MQMIFIPFLGGKSHAKSDIFAPAHTIHAKIVSEKVSHILKNRLSILSQTFSNICIHFLTTFSIKSITVTGTHLTISVFLIMCDLFLAHRERGKSIFSLPLHHRVYFQQRKEKTIFYVHLKVIFFVSKILEK